MYEKYNSTIITVGIDFNDTISLQLNSGFIQYWESVFTDSHTELVDCWALIVEAFNEGHIDADDVNYYAGLMGTPVSVVDPNSEEYRKFTMEYAIEINDLMLEDEVFASQIQSLWTSAAKAQYADVYTQVLALFP
jgi:hypothetical protein